MPYTGTYMGYNMVEISVDEYRSSRYVSRCRIVSDNPYRRTVTITEDEYRYAKEKEIRNNGNFAQQWFMANNGMLQQAQCGISSIATGTIAPLTKKKEEKVSKTIRHQFLRKRITERVNAKV